MHLPIPFRVARSRSTATHLLWTIAQSAAIWGLTLVLVPALLVGVERWLGLRGFDLPGRQLLAAVLFATASVLNLTTGAILAARGHGTPLPLACPRTLVVTGPYRFVRNPMAMAGIGQGIAVALWLGSWLVLAYALAGAVAWHALLRPAEELDLAARFGPAYARYRGAVPLWWPRARPYDAPGTSPHIAGGA